MCSVAVDFLLLILPLSYLNPELHVLSGTAYPSAPPVSPHQTVKLSHTQNKILSFPFRVCVPVTILSREFICSKMTSQMVNYVYSKRALASAKTQHMV